MTTGTRPRLGALLVFNLALAGCGDGDDPPRIDPPALPAPTPLPECPDADYRTCDVRDPACERRSMELAACLRGSAPFDVPTEVIGEDEYRERLRQSAAEHDPAGADVDSLLAVLGLASVVPGSDAIEARVENLAGFYSVEQKRITVIDHGAPADSAQTDAVLVHELVHALQDADYDLAHWPDDEPRGFDSALAEATVVEGEASFYEYRAAVSLLGNDIAAVDFEAALRAHLEDAITRAVGGAQPLPTSLRTVPYGIGAMQAYRAWQQGGPRGMDAIWANPPRTMQRVMAKLFGGDEPPEDLPPENPPHDSGVEITSPTIEELSLQAGDVLGAWTLYLLLARAGSAQATERALRWRGDRFGVYVDEAGSSSALWQLEFESAAAAREWNDFFSRFQVIHESFATRVYVAYGDHGEPAARPLIASGQAWLGR